MLRTSAARLLSASARQATYRPIRPISSSAPTFIRIKKPEGSAPSNPPNPPPKGSPAEKPAAVPEDLASPPPFEPQVNRPIVEPSATAPTPGVDPLKSAVPPSEPPAPDAKAAADAAAAEDIPDVPDLSKLPSLDIDPEANVPAAEQIEQPKEKEEGVPGKKRAGGARQRPEYVSSQEKSRRKVMIVGYSALLMAGLGALWYVGNQENDKNKDLKGVDRFKKNMSELGDVFSKPALQKLLPDPLPPTHQRPYTLLVDLDDLLVHHSWDRQHGWRTAKRPGVDYFLGYLSQFYEIVLFTNQPNYTAGTVVEKLDPFGILLPYRLFRENTRFVDGHVVKDLSYLNRDLSKVVLLDTNPEHASLQPDNAVIIKPWRGTPGDRGLVDMIPFLESIGIYAPADVRPVLKNYAGKDIPLEYAKAEAAAKAAAIAEWERRNPVNSGGGGWAGSLFGGGASSRPKQPMTYLEIKREQAQKAYQHERDYYAEHHDEFVKALEEDKKRMMEEHGGSILSMFGGRKPAAEGQDAAKQPEAKA